MTLPLFPGGPGQQGLRCLLVCLDLLQERQTASHHAHAIEGVAVLEEGQHDQIWSIHFLYLLVTEELKYELGVICDLTLIFIYVFFKFVGVGVVEVVGLDTFCEPVEV